MTKKAKSGDLSSTEPRKRKRTGPQCKAHKKNGERCGNPPIRGGTTCHKHGGAAKQVREKANERLLEMVLPALAKLRKIILSPKTSDADAIRAIREVLNRTGFTERFGMDVLLKEPTKWDQMFDEMADTWAGMDEDERRAHSRFMLGSGYYDDAPAIEPSVRDQAFTRSKITEDAEAEARREWADLEEEDEDRARARSGTRLVDGSPTHKVTGGGLLDRPDPPLGPSEYGS